LDQRVLATLIDRQTYNKLANGTLDAKTVIENEIPEILTPRRLKSKKVKSEESDAASVQSKKAGFMLN
jgi:hypothetical protein